MHIGEQLSDLSARKLTWAAQLGVEHLSVAAVPAFRIQNDDGTWHVGNLKKLREHTASFGMSVDVMTLGQEAQPFDRHRFPALWRGLPGRDAEIETIKQNVRAAGEAGIGCLKYNVNLIGILRTGRTVGRGGARYSHFDVREWQDHSLTEAGELGPERLWEAVAYFLERVIPVAEEAGVRMAAHPHDPALPRETGLRGIHSILGTIEGMERFANIVPSRANGFNFCVGTIAEMSTDPKREVLEAIRYFGEQKNICMVHMRNIKGGYLNFDEVYPDNGDVDFFEAIRVFHDVGYDGMLCPDHVPESDADPDNERQHSFCLGYLRAMIQAAEAHSRQTRLPPSVRRA